MKLSWAYLLQLVSASFFLQSVAAAPVAEAAPAPVERAIKTRHGDQFLWFIDEEEKDRLGEILGINFRATGVTGIIVDGPKQKCRGCRKYTGFDDFVHNALEDNIHGKDFMIKVIEERGPQPSHPHEIRCSGAGCGMVHVEKRAWFVDWVSSGDATEASDTAEAADPVEADVTTEDVDVNEDA